MPTINGAFLFMKTPGVLILYGSVLFTEAISHLLKAEGIKVVAEVATLEAAQRVIDTHQVQAVIVDNDAHLQRAEVLFQLGGNKEDYLIIFLTMVSNRMTVHSCRQIDNITTTDLIEALNPVLATLKRDEL